jgi:ABC-2 type transport system permease protein
MLRRAALDLRMTVFWFGLGMAAYGLLIVQVWPTMRANSEVFAQYIRSFPEALMKAFGVTDLTTFAGFIGAEYLNFTWPLIASVFVVTAGSAVVAQEIDRGTIELWLSVPERRWRLLGAKLGALLLGVVVIAAVSVVAIAIGSPFVGEAPQPTALAATGLVLASYGVAVAGYCALFSSFLSERAKAAGLGAAVTLASYLASIIGGLSKDVEGLKYLSLSSAFHPQLALESGAPSWTEVGALFGIGVVCALAALVAFERRDVAP